MEQTKSTPDHPADVITIQCPSCNTCYRIGAAAIKSYPAHATCKKCNTRIRIEAPEPLEPEVMDALDVSQPVAKAPQPAPDTQPAPAAAPGATGAMSTETQTDALPLFIERNVSHYLGKFKAFDRQANDGFAATWHWPAFFFTPFWFLYRKLYGWAILSLVLGFVPFLNWILKFVWGITANYIYYRHAQKRITTLKHGHPQLSDQQMAMLLQKKGGVHSWVWATAALPIVGIIASIAIPQFVTYRNRAYDTSARAAVETVMTAQQIYHSEHGQYADSIELLRSQLEGGQITAPIEVVIHSAGVEDYSVEGFHPKGAHRYTGNASSSSAIEMPMATRDLYGPNKWCKVTLPADWQAMEQLNTDADIQAGNLNKDTYLIVIVEDKTEFFGVDLESFAELTSTGIEDNLLSVQTVTTNLDSVGQREAIQHKITGSIPDSRIRVVYLHTVVQGQRGYYQILAWTSEENYAANQELLKSVSRQLIEL